MNARLAVKLVAVTESMFNSWPSDRSLKLLSEDARALRRRATKGVGVEIQRGLFVQVARRIDSLAMEIQSTDQLTLVGKEAEAWLQLDYLLSRENAAALIRPKIAAPPPPQPPLPVEIHRSSLWSKLVAFFRSTRKDEVTVVPPSITPPPPPEFRAPVLGEQMLFPGEEVSAWHSTLVALNAEPLCETNAHWKQLNQLQAESVLNQARSFFETAGAKRCAVVQVLIDAVYTETEVSHG